MAVMNNAVLIALPKSDAQILRLLLGAIKKADRKDAVRRNGGSEAQQEAAVGVVSNLIEDFNAAGITKEASQYPDEPEFEEEDFDVAF